MVKFRVILAAMIALGLSLAPAAGVMPAAKAATAPAATMDDCPHHKAAAKTAAKTEAPCPSGGDMTKCNAAFCALKCFKVVALFAVPAQQRPIYVAPAESTLPEALFSVAWRPTTPPPRS